MADTYVTGGAQAAVAIDRLLARVDRATRQAVAEGAALLERQAKQNSSGRPGPNVQSGAHRSGIVTEGPTRAGSHSWQASVRPTMVYSRRLELGGGNWPAGVRFPYFEPAFRSVLPRLGPLFDRAYSGAVRGL